jgi:hypothetical protein
VRQEPVEATVRTEQEAALSRVVERQAREIVSLQSPSRTAPSSLPLIPPPAREIPLAQSQNETTLAPLPNVSAPAAPLNVESPRLPRLSPTARESPSAEAVRPRTIGPTPSRDPVAVVAPELRDDSSNRQRPEIVWRKPPDGPRAAHFTAQGPGTAAPAIPIHSGTTAPANPVQFNHKAAAPTAPQGGQTGAPPPPRTQGEPLRAEPLSPLAIRAISERVIRAITLDLKLERERRGIMKWR